MVGMPEIDILDVGMVDKILGLVCWNKRIKENKRIKKKII